jgi:hypothetical protein
MKTSHRLLCIGVGCMLGMAGLAQKRTVDTSALERHFSAAEPSTRISADQAVLLIKVADYPRALAQLKKLTADRRITPEQRHALREILAKVERSCTRATGKAAVADPIPAGNPREISAN